MRWAGHVACISERRNAYRVLAWRHEGKRPLGRPTHRWDGNTKMDLRKVGWDPSTAFVWRRIGTGGGLL
jgi:hypothetical protein